MINKIIIVAVVLCLFFSIMSKGLLSASFDLSAFTLLMYYLYKKKSAEH
ncbi:hypothetical protein ACR30L_19970 [Psychromonas sp. PT13]